MAKLPATTSTSVPPLTSARSTPAAGAELPAGLPASTGRRSLLRGGVVGGFALAVLPVSAETLHTTADGLLAGMVEVPAADRTLPAYRAQPAGAGPFPVVLVVHEIFGVHEYIQDVCRRFAHQGYLAIAPDLYVRHGNVAQLASIQEIIDQVLAKVGDAQVMGDLDATLAWARAHGGKAGPAGVTGFCWGGRITWLYAAHQPDIGAGVAWYGRLRGAGTPLTPRHPLDLVGSLKAPVLGLYGGKDDGIPLADVEAMRQALAQAQQPSRLEVFEQAPHGFHADYRPSYRPAEAAQAWGHALAWFSTHGV